MTSVSSVTADLRQRVSGLLHRTPSTVVPRQILVVDSQAASRATTAHLVTSLGFEALQAAGLAQALTQLEEQDPEFVLLAFDLSDPDDLEGGDHDGLESLEQIRSVAPEVPVIMVAANLWDPRVAAAMRHGAVAYLARPIGRDDLREVLGRR